MKTALFVLALLVAGCGSTEQHRAPGDPRCCGVVDGLYPITRMDCLSRETRFACDCAVWCRCQKLHD